MILYQVGFPTTGRQALFQGVFHASSGESVLELVGAFFFVTQDDGVDMGLILEYEHLPQPVWGVPEAPFCRIMRRATQKEIGTLEFKHQEEAKALELTRMPGLLVPQHMTIQCCEMSYDRTKLIVFALQPAFVDFGEFVKAFHVLCFRIFGYRLRIFVQRKGF
jgi:hypothetical protein